MDPEPIRSQTSLNNISILAKLHEENFIDSVKQTEIQIHQVCDATIGQAKNPFWHLARQYRITASQFGFVIKSRGASESFIERLIDPKNLKGVKAIEWGIKHEQDGIDFFQKHSKLIVKSCGIWLSESGLLGASPDGLVGDDAVIEVKCPFSKRLNSIAEIASDKSFFIEINGSNYFLKESHNYYHQIQGQLHLSRRNLCYMVVWTLIDAVVIKVDRNLSWARNIDLIENFYLAYLLPKLIEKHFPQPTIQICSSPSGLEDFPVESSSVLNISL